MTSTDCDRTGARPSPRVSVVMAVYNGDRYLREAIDSILTQTFADFEFIVVNDGSTDGTLGILRSYNDPRLIVEDSQRNVGLAQSLNRGVSRAQGEYIVRQDADDFSSPKRISRQVEYLDEHRNIGVVGAATQWIDGHGNPLRVWPGAQNNCQLQQLLVSTCPLIHGSAAYRHQAFDEVGGYDVAMRTGQDYDFWLRVSEGWDLACLPEVLYTYRYHPEMASVGRREEQMHNAETSRTRAIRRRVLYARLALGRGRSRLPTHLAGLSRRGLAQRYVWWSAGSRATSRVLALRFLLLALLVDPSVPEARSYLRGILRRKVGLGNSHTASGVASPNRSGEGPEGCV
jgi:glycosyltransferase involved in cell wall biosynthesis